MLGSKSGVSRPLPDAEDDDDDADDDEIFDCRSDFVIAGETRRTEHRRILERPARRFAARFQLVHERVEPGNEVRIHGHVHDVVHLVRIVVGRVQLTVAVRILDVQIMLRAHAVVLGNRTRTGDGHRDDVLATHSRLVVEVAGLVRPRLRIEGLGTGRARMLEQIRVPWVRVGVGIVHEVGERRSVDEARGRNPGQLCKRRSEIDVAGHEVAGLVRRHTGTTHDQRHANIAFVRRLLSGRHPELPEVEAVVGAEHEVGVLELTGLPQRVDETDDAAVDGLQRPDAIAVERVEILDPALAEVRQVTQPAGLARNVRVEARRPRRGAWSNLFMSCGAGVAG